METISNFVEQTEHLRSDYTCVFTADSDITEQDAELLFKSGCAIKTKLVTSVFVAHNAGIPRDLIYFDISDHAQNEIKAVFGKCCYLLSSADKADLLDTVVKGSLRANTMEAIGIRMLPDDNTADFITGIPVAQLSVLSEALKKADSISARGIFICPGPTKFTSGGKLKSYFSLIKEVQSLLPCTFSYFCIENLIERISTINEKVLEQELAIIRSLNNTSLHARFMIS